MRARISVYLILLLTIAGILITSCTQTENRHRSSSVSVPKEGSNKGAIRLKQTGLIADAMWPTYNTERDELAYERLLGTNFDPWIFIRKGNRETKIATGDQPSLSKRGLYYLVDSELMFKQGAKMPVSLHLVGISSVVASKDGNKLLIDDPIHGGQSNFFVYDVRTKQRREVVSSKITPLDVPGTATWGPDDSIYFDAWFDDGWHGICSLDLTEKEPKPKRLLKDYAAPAISLDGKYLICLGDFGNDVGDLVVFDLKTMKKIAQVAPDVSTLFGASFDPPIACLPGNRLAVTEEKIDRKTNGADYTKQNIKIYQILN